MNNIYRHFALHLAIFTTILVTACGGGGGNQVSGIDGSGAPVGSTPQTFASGTINGFGSVIVNGVHYASDKAKILVNDQQANEDSLHAGYQVKIIAHTDTSGNSIADTIEFHSNLTGTITNIDLAAQEFVVLGHRVKVTNDTLFDIAISPNYLEGLSIGKLVLVSGFADEAGVISATRVDLVTGNNRQALGAISNLNLTNNTFTLNNLTVNYSAAALTNFDNNALTSGLLVNATGTLDSNGVLQATTLVRISTALDKNVKEAEIKGLITRFASSTDFDVAGTKVTTDASTTYDNGTLANLMAGAAVEIKGQVNTAGILLAQRVEFANVVSNQIAGKVTNIQASGTGVITTGSLQINGVNIQTNLRTAYEDKGNSRLKRFNFSTIEVNNFLKVSGYIFNGNFIATKIEREDIESENETTLKFEGLVISTEPHSFVIVGGGFITNGDTEIKGANGQLLTEAQFRLIAVGKQVKVEALLKNNIMTATKIEVIEHI